MQFRARCIFEESCTILAFTFLYPMSIDTECASIDHLLLSRIKIPIKQCSSVLAETFYHTFRSTLTRYGSFSESSIRNGSNVYLNRLIRTIARMHNIAYWNFLRALNWLCRLSCNFKRGKIDILSLIFDFRCKKERNNERKSV